MAATKSPAKRELWGEPLTPREREVLCYVAYMYKETAKILGIRRNTVKNHWHTIYGKILGPRTPEWREAHSLRIMALLQALGLGIITLKEIKDGTKRHETY